MALYTMKQILADAREKGYGVGYFNAVNMEMVRANIRTVDVPLVLHGGSGLSREDFRNTIRGGICKINVYTDVILAAREALNAAGKEAYPEQCRLAEEAMVQATAEKLRLFGSENRA